jgi:hypothetical protein
LPYGLWGLIVAGDRDQHGPVLLAIAFGERHPQRRPSVYDIGHHPARPAFWLGPS